MKGTRKPANRMLSAIVRNSAKIGICGTSVALWMSISACDLRNDGCENVTSASARVVKVFVDRHIYVKDIYAIGECTDVVEGMDTPFDELWETEMTGRIGSTCTVYVDSEAIVREETTTLEDDRYCGYPGADAIVFIKE